MSDTGTINVRLRLKGAWLVSFKLWLLARLAKNLNVRMEVSDE